MMNEVIPMIKLQNENLIKLLGISISKGKFHNQVIVFLLLQLMPRDLSEVLREKELYN